MTLEQTLADVFNNTAESVEREDDKVEWHQGEGDAWGKAYWDGARQILRELRASLIAKGFDILNPPIEITLDTPEKIEEMSCESTSKVPPAPST